MNPRDVIRILTDALRNIPDNLVLNSYETLKTGEAVYDKGDETSFPNRYHESAAAALESVTTHSRERLYLWRRYKTHDLGSGVPDSVLQDVATVMHTVRTKDDLERFNKVFRSIEPEEFVDSQKE